MLWGEHPSLPLAQKDSEQTESMRVTRQGLWLTSPITRGRN